jgi:hypothetical protein
MKRTWKVTLTCLAILGLVAVSSACSNAPPPPAAEEEAPGGCQSDCLDGACVACRADKHCQANSKCMQCSKHECVPVKNCCITDADCGDGTRCFHVKRKSYGKCGSE